MHWQLVTDNPKDVEALNYILYEANKIESLVCDARRRARGESPTNSDAGSDESPTGTTSSGKKTNAAAIAVPALVLLVAAVVA